MTRRFGLPVLIVFVAVALAAAACSKESPSAPTAVPTSGPTAEGAFDTSSGGTAVVGGTLARPGAVAVKGIIKSITLESHTFVLLARNGNNINVRVTPRTLFAAGTNPRAKLAFRSLRPGMAVDVVGKMDKGVLVANSVVVLKLPPRPAG